MVFRRNSLLSSNFFVLCIIIISPSSSSLYRNCASAWTLSSPQSSSSSTNRHHTLLNDRSIHRRLVPSSLTSRDEFIRQVLVVSSGIVVPLSSHPRLTNAAPPFAVMSEEMGYFPIIDEVHNTTIMVPAYIRRASTEQAVSLATYLRSSGAVMYGAFWCPHCRRQRELFGKEAFKLLNYIECDPRGYKSQYATCLTAGVNGYPSWKFGNGKVQDGEMELIEIAKLSGYNNIRKKQGKLLFDASLETGVPSLGGASCQQ